MNTRANSSAISTLDNRPVYCCIPIEFIQPWEQNHAIRQVKKLHLGNMVMLQGTFHVGNSKKERQLWKRKFPSLAKKIDATPFFPERPEHGMAVLFDLPIEFRLRQLRLCKKLGLRIFCFFPPILHLPPEDYDRVMKIGKDIIYSECFMGENLSILANTLSLEQLKKIDVKLSGLQNDSKKQDKTAPGIFDNPDALDFQLMHDWFVDKFQDVAKKIRARCSLNLSAIEASCQMRLAMEAGADIPVLELVPHEPLRALAAVRGAAKAYKKLNWGVHTALGYYRNPANEWTPERLRIAYNLFFAAGANIFSEPNLPLRNWGLCSGFFTIKASPAMQEGDKECRGFMDPVCVRAREIVAEHYRFTQFHKRPAPNPRVRLGYMLGNLDCWTGSETEQMWMVNLPGFAASDALKTWHHFERIFESEPWYAAPRKYYWQADPVKPLYFGTPPCGQVDIVPAEAPLDVLNTYGALVFLGWNTMAANQYEKLKLFVRNGGTLFLGIPHLDTRTRADRHQAIFRGGDVRDLCGVKISARTVTVSEIFFVRQASNGRERFPKGTLYLEEAPMAELELCGAQVLAHARELPAQPVLLEHRYGKGVVYLLANREYPGNRLDAFITDILRTLADAQQQEITVESRDVFYALYDGIMPSGEQFSLIYLVNHDIYGQVSYPVLHARGTKIPVRVPGYEMRIVWVFDNLILSPCDRFVKIVDAERDGNTWIITLAAQSSARQAPGKEKRTIQIETIAGSIHAVKMRGRLIPLRTGPEGDRVVSCRLYENNVMRIELCDTHSKPEFLC